VLADADGGFGVHFFVGANGFANTMSNNRSIACGYAFRPLASPLSLSFIILDDRRLAMVLCAPIPSAPDATPVLPPDVTPAGAAPRS